jgi:hypothetical protein
MKKLLIPGLTVFSFFIVNAQKINVDPETSIADPAKQFISSRSANYQQGKTQTTLVHDTLNYFFNKHYYKNSTTPTSAPPNLSFYTIKSPYSSTLAIDGCGAVFLNSTTIAVNGLEGLVMKNPGSTSASVPVKLYLCNVNANNLPVLPPLDSVMTNVSNSTAGVWAGGSFTAPVTVTSNFAVYFKTGSTVPGDTVRLFLNNACSATATGVPNTQKFGEGLGLIRFNGNFQSTSGAFNGTPGNDYEFIVTPWVSHNINSVPVVFTPTVCNGGMGSFGNNSGPLSIIEHRMFNFNKFRLYWATVATGGVNSLCPAIDSLYYWTFTGSPTPPTTAKTPTAMFNAFGTQSANLTVKLRRNNQPWNQSSLLEQSTASIVVDNGSAPAITVSGGTAFCSNSAITTTLFCTGNPTFTWTAPINSVSSIVVITTSAASSMYTVTAQNGGCIAIKTVTITVKPVPSVSLTLGKQTVCTNATGGTTIALTGAPTGGSYSGTHVSGAVFSPATTGTFTPTYTYTDAATSCTNSASGTIVVKNCVGISQVSQNQNLSFYPNPVLNGTLTIKNLEGSNTIEVYNILGVSIYKQLSTKEEITLDFSSAPSGNYFLKVIDSSGQSKTLKIVNQN